MYLFFSWQMSVCRIQSHLIRRESLRFLVRRLSGRLWRRPSRLSRTETAWCPTFAHQMKSLFGVSISNVVSYRRCKTPCLDSIWITRVWKRLVNIDYFWSFLSAHGLIEICVVCYCNICQFFIEKHNLVWYYIIRVMWRELARSITSSMVPFRILLTLSKRGILHHVPTVMDNSILSLPSLTNSSVRYGY